MTPFRFRDCACPGKPHDGKEGRDDGDTVTFRPRLPFSSGVKALRLIFSDTETAAANALPVYLTDGPEAWNLVDERGQPVPLTPEALEDLPFADQYEIGDQGDTLYGGEVVAPLLRRMSKSSETGPTTTSSRRRSPRSPRPR
jgi:hypothetical protein